MIGIYKDVNTLAQVAIIQCNSILQIIRKTNKFIHRQLPFMQAEIAETPTKILDIPQHSYVQFAQPNQPSIFFNSKFDSGNLSKVVRNSYDHYCIWTASDAQGTQYSGYPKSWFYFQVGGFNKRKVSFSIHRVHFLWSIANKSHLYRPVYRVKLKTQNSEYSQKLQEWKRLPHPIQSLTINSQEQLVLKFDFNFSENFSSVQFAFIYPYSHEKCHNDMKQIQEQFQKDQDIFVKQYELCRTYQKRIIDMILISSHQGKDGFESIKTDQTFTLGEKKLQKFRNNKPIIFISARVHPIQTPSSYTMLGIIKYLLDKKDYRSHLLRKYFVFVLIPMLNPDGVSNGHCRMDALNQNLNRYYKNPDPIKQPSCYSVMKLCEYYDKDKRLFMYLDLHAHPANKGNFIFGNAIFDYIEQVESHLFPKILSNNCINFQFQQCNFSRKHMKAKDRNQDMNKQGCGRVVFYKQFGLTHSYTLQCEYHCNAYNNVIQQQSNENKIYIARYKLNDKKQNIYDGYEQCIVEDNQDNIQKYIENIKQRKGCNGLYSFKMFNCTKDQLDNIQTPFYKKQLVFFQQQTFYNLGRNICISVLDVWNKNPYTRLFNINELRVEIAEKQAKLDRFRKQQVGIKTKQKKVVELIETQLYAQWHKRNVFQTQVISATGFKKSLVKTSQNIKRTQKSMTITQIKQELQMSGSTTKISINKNFMRTKKSLNKQEKKIGAIHSNIQSIKTIIGTDFVKLPCTLKSTTDAKNLFKPMNIKIRNLQIGNK